VRQVLPAAELHYFDGGRFVLDEYADEIAEAIIETFFGQDQRYAAHDGDCSELDRR
jgi:hypothetical protein